jgi:endonuclease/exonuclease/phosphatase family metal-dependent hydrolase
VPALRAVTYNLGCGGPHAAARVEAAHQWAAAAVDAYDLVFVQEIPAEGWLEPWRSTHHVISTPSPRYQVRSAVIVAKSLTRSPVTFRTASYHDSYVAAAAVTSPGNHTVTCVSVHASPSPISPEWRQLWEACGVPLPAPRAGEDLWDSDLLLASVIELSQTRSLLVAGDWNEARTWDDTHPGTSGAQFFERVTAANLVDCTWEAWHGEKPTCRPTNGASLQVDHVFATPDVAPSVRELRVAEPLQASGSDHFPITFTADFDAAS